jgi:actin-related protein 5
MERKKLEKQEISTRNSRLNQKRMQTLAHLGSDINLQKSKKGLEDTFGMNDEDWNIYRGISRDYGSDEENFENKLNEVEIELREMDPGY